MSGCVGCPYVRVMEATRPVGYAVVCDHPDFARMQGRLLVRREVFDSRDKAEPPTRRPGFCHRNKLEVNENGLQQGYSDFEK